MKIKKLILTVIVLTVGLFSGTALAQAASTAEAPTYKAISSLKTVNYYTKMRPSGHNYGLYKSGGWKTSETNVSKIGASLTYKNKTIHITREEKTVDGTWLKFTYNHTYTAWVHQNATVKSYRYLNVPLIAQRPELPPGCEITAVTMMLKYAGANVNKTMLANQMPRSRNPDKGFVGSPYSKTGWYIYPKGLMKIVKKYAGSSVNMTGSSFNQIKDKINQGRAVVVCVCGVDGFVNHALTVRGYSSTRVYYNDPWTKKKTSMTITSLHNHRKKDAYRALSY